MTLKKLILLIALALMAMPALAQYEDEIVWLKFNDEIGANGRILNAVFTPDEKSILVTSEDKLVEVNLMTGEVIREIPNIRGVYKFSDDGKYVYTYDLKKVNWETGEVVKDYPKSGKEVNHFDINEKAGLLVVDYIYDESKPWQPGGIEVYDLNTTQLIKAIGFQDHFYAGLQIFPDGKFFIAQSFYDPNKTDTVRTPNVATIWDTKTLDTLFTNRELGIIKISPDGKWLASGNRMYVRVYDAKTWQKKYEWNPGEGFGANIALDFTPDSKYLATGGNGGKNVENISIWDLETGKLSYRYHTESQLHNTERITFTSDSQYMLVSGPAKVGYFRSILIGTGINNNNKNNSDDIYPNPTTGVILFSNSGLNSGQLHVVLADLQGNLLKILYDGMYNNEELRFNISDQPDGSYFLKAAQNNKTYTYKVIKER